MRARKTRIAKRPIYSLEMQTIIPTEYQECRTFWQYIERSGMKDDWVKHANERQNDESWFIQALYAIGFKKGLPDYQYIVSSPTYHTLWIEMKRKNQRNHKKRPEQDVWIQRLLRRGHYASYAYGCDDAISIFNDYVNNKL